MNGALHASLLILHCQAEYWTIYHSWVVSGTSCRYSLLDDVPGFITYCTGNAVCYAGFVVSPRCYHSRPTSAKRLSAALSVPVARLKFYRQPPRRLYCWRAAFTSRRSSTAAEQGYPASARPSLDDFYHRRRRRRHSAVGFRSFQPDNTLSYRRSRVNSTCRWSDAPLSPRSLGFSLGFSPSSLLLILLVVFQGALRPCGATSPPSVFQAAGALRSPSHCVFQLPVCKGITSSQLFVSPRKRPTWSRWNKYEQLLCIRHQLNS